MYSKESPKLAQFVETKRLSTHPQVFPVSMQASNKKGLWNVSSVPNVPTIG